MAVEIDAKVVLGLLAFLGAAYFLTRSRARSSKLPPTPPGLPIIGNLPDIIKYSSKGILHVLMNEYAQKYGEIVRVQAGPTSEYFLNSAQAVKALMEQGTAQTSERPRWIYSNEHVCNKRNVLLLSASDPRWKIQRKVITNHMTSVQMADSALPLNYFETARFLQAVATDPKAGTPKQKIWKKLKRYQYSLFALQTFGFPVEDEQDPVIDYIFETGLAQIIGTLPGEKLVETFPFLDKLPLFMKPWEQEGRARYARDLDWARKRLQRTKEVVKTGTSIPSSALANLVQDPRFAGLEDEDEAAYLSLMLIIGAADTSLITIWSALEACVCSPEAQAKAQAELDAVVPDRLPRYEDLDNLPYIRMFMKETWRWRPPVALGHPHTTTKDLVYNNMVIPKGAYLHLNAWAIQHDPRRFAEPEKFRPERHQGDETSTAQTVHNPDPDKRAFFVFGAGRRVCPGYHVAERSFAVVLMRILWSFNIAVKPGYTAPFAPTEFTGPMPGTRNEDMPVTLTPRSEVKKKIIQAEYDSESAEFSFVKVNGTL